MSALMSALTADALADRYRKLEGPISELEYMALLATGAIEDTMAPTADITGRPDWRYISDQQANTVLFSAYHLLRMIQDVRTKYYDGLGEDRAGEPSAAGE